MDSGDSLSEALAQTALLGPISAATSENTDKKEWEPWSRTHALSIPTSGSVSIFIQLGRPFHLSKLHI